MSEPLWKSIDGWFDFEDVYQSFVDRFSNGDVFCEVGNFYGKSACFMAEAIRNSGKNIKLICVDNNSNFFKELIRNIELGGYSDIVQCLFGNSVEIAASQPDGKFAVVFIDADHKLESVKADIAAWRPKVRPGGVLAGHDYCETWPGVMQAVDEEIGRGNFNRIFRTWIFEVKS